ncbi:MAG TPA: methyltransferase domain-containing protein [Verrucomicrobiae bacterium]|nr:methyltransferase domain-containing protein [Verrucomicrobiae bacterium]
MTSDNETDWEGLYQAQTMQWEKGAPSPGLVDFLELHPELPKGTVSVPGCGTGHDVRAWAKAGFDAHGFDIAPSAIQLSTEKTEGTGLKASFHLCDFLDETKTPKSLGTAFANQAGFDWLFEHTLFCAINPDRRDEYVRALPRWLKPDGQFLAVFYLISDTDGPPFGTTKEEILSRFSPGFELLEEWVPRSYPNRTNLEWMTWWRQRVPKPSPTSIPT